jgi:hypothetical protein
MRCRHRSTGAYSTTVSDCVEPNQRSGRGRARNCSAAAANVSESVCVCPTLATRAVLQSVLHPPDRVGPVARRLQPLPPTILVRICTRRPNVPGPVRGPHDTRMPDVSIAFAHWTSHRTTYRRYRKWAFFSLYPPGAVSTTPSAIAAGRRFPFWNPARRSGSSPLAEASIGARPGPPTCRPERDCETPRRLLHPP